MKINKYENKNYKELIKSLYMNEIKDTALLIITPDSIQRGLVPDILDYLKNKHGASVIGSRLKYLKDYEIEQLYRYSFKKKIVEDDYTFWWLIERTYKNFPCVILFLHSKQHVEETFVETVLKYKGSFSEKCEPVDETIRDKFGGIGRILAVVHSSDDIESMFRELLLFFSEDEIIKIFNNIDQDIQREDLINMNKALDMYDYSAFRNSLISRIMTCIKVYYSEEKDLILKLENLLKNVQINETLELIYYRYNNTDDIRLKCYLEIILLLNSYIEFEWDKNYKDLCRNNNLLFTDWEEILFLNYLLVQE